MATLFKINQITNAMELQDEADKQKIFLMGLADRKPDFNSNSSLPTPQDNYLGSRNSFVSSAPTSEGGISTRK